MRTTTRPRSLLRAAGALAFAVALSAGECAAAQAPADPYAALRAYDQQDRTAIAAIQRMVVDAGNDRAKQAPIEASLISIVADPSATFAAKQEACKLLWVVGGKASVPVLAAMLPDEKTSDIARLALERNPDPAAGAALRSALRKCAGPALVGVIGSVGARGDARAVGALRRLVASTDPLVAASAINALGKIATPQAITYLRATYRRTAPSTLISLGIELAKRPVRAAAGQALADAAAELAAQGKAKDAERIYVEFAAPFGEPDIRGAAVVGLAAMGSPKAVGTAIELAKSDDVYLQRVGGQVAASILDPSATKAVVAAWDQLPQDARVAMLTAFAERREQAALPLALRAVPPEDQDMVVARLRAAGRLGGEQAANTLAYHAGSALGGVETVARECLVQIPGDAAESAILGLAKSGDPPVREALMAVLAERRTPAGKALLMEVASDPAGERVAAAALRAIGRYAGAAEIPQLVKIMASSEREDVLDAAQGTITAAAQRSGNRDGAAEAVVAALDSAKAPTRLAMLGTLAQIGGDRAFTRLSEAARSGDADVKRAAITGLAESWSDPSAMPLLLDIAKAESEKSLRVVALRGYLRLAGVMDPGKPEDQIARVKDAMAAAERPDEKRMALSVLRDCRTPAAVEMAAQSLDDPELFEDAANAVIDLASPQRRERRDLAAVKGPATTAALDKVIQQAKDDDLRSRAEKAR